MHIESDREREQRQARAAAGAGAALLVAGLAFALLVRFRPEMAVLLVPLGTPAAATHTTSQQESAALAGSASAGAAAAVADTSAASLRDTASRERDSVRVPADSTPADSTPAFVVAVLQDSGRRGRLVTDLILLPCSTANPRPDGSILIPPHNPRHRTVVGLPQRPGDPPRGFVIPPHDPKQENQVPIRIIPIDSLLARTLRVPPHNPREYTIVRPDSMGCLADSDGSGLPR